MTPPRRPRLPVIDGVAEPVDDRPFRGARPIAALLALAALSLAGCLVHAVLARRVPSLSRVSAAREVASRTFVDAPALASPEDLRHPGWARPEMPLGGQPTLVDPRAAALVVRPPAMQVAP